MRLRSSWRPLRLSNLQETKSGNGGIEQREMIRQKVALEVAGLIVAREEKRFLLCAPGILLR